MLGQWLETPHSSATLRKESAGAGAGAGPSGEIFPLNAAKIHAPRVLIVDDEALLRWSLAEMLSAAGYEALEAADGKAARRIFADAGQPVDVMLLDLKLPDASGLQLLQEARRRCLTCPIVLMTAYGTSDTLDAALASGACRVVSKPFDLDDMLRVVREVCPPD